MHKHILHSLFKAGPLGLCCPSPVRIYYVCGIRSRYCSSSRLAVKVVTAPNQCLYERNEHLDIKKSTEIYIYQHRYTSN